MKLMKLYFCPLLKILVCVSKPAFVKSGHIIMLLMAQIILMNLNICRNVIHNNHTAHVILYKTTLPIQLCM